tara:strand:+ start:516 stop:1025 length:510 start_codon:yes stop_codon:yes gene_type:complete
MPSKNLLGVEDVEVKSDSEETSNEDLESLLLSSSDENEFKNEFVDERLEVVTRARSLIMYWHQLHQQLSQVREGYSLAKLWEDDELKGQYMEQGRPLIKKEKILNEVIRDVLGELKNVPFLSQPELLQLPKWMLKTLNVRLDDADSVNGTGDVSEVVEEPVIDSAKSRF